MRFTDAFGREETNKKFSQKTRREDIAWGDLGVNGQFKFNY
jgi:hypothetical protein